MNSDGIRKHRERKQNKQQIQDLWNPSESAEWVPTKKHVHTFFFKKFKNSNLIPNINKDKVKNWKTLRLQLQMITESIKKKKEKKDNKNEMTLYTDALVCVWKHPCFKMYRRFNETAIKVKNVSRIWPIKLTHHSKCLQSKSYSQNIHFSVTHAQTFLTL